MSTDWLTGFAAAVLLFGFGYALAIAGWYTLELRRENDRLDKIVELAQRTGRKKRAEEVQP